MISKNLIWRVMLELTQNEGQGVQKTCLKHHAQALHKVLKYKQRLLNQTLSNITSCKSSYIAQNASYRNSRTN